MYTIVFLHVCNRYSTFMLLKHCCTPLTGTIQRRSPDFWGLFLRLFVHFRMYHGYFNSPCPQNETSHSRTRHDGQVNLRSNWLAPISNGFQIHPGWREILLSIARWLNSSSPLAWSKSVREYWVWCCMVRSLACVIGFGLCLDLFAFLTRSRKESIAKNCNNWNMTGLSWSHDQYRI